MRIPQIRAGWRLLIPFFMLAGWLALFSPVSTYAQQTKPRDGLDTQLQTANMCGSGDPAETHFTLAATGDTFLHDSIQRVGESAGYDYLFDRLRPYLKAADLAYTNFDGAMLTGSSYTGYPAFNFNPALAPALKNAGIGLVSTANNHILDRGAAGVDANLDVFEKAGILQHGTVRSRDANQPRPTYLPLTLKREGVSMKVAFLSFSWGTNGITDPNNQVNLLFRTNDYGQQGGLRQQVLDDIAKARAENDLVIVAPHWGYEYKFYPEAFQTETAKRMAEAGADIIMGSQSHTLQPVDVLFNAGGRRTLVIYSLANFIASQGQFQEQFFSDTATIFYIGIARAPNGKARVTGYRYLPTMMMDYSTRPGAIPLEGYQALINHVRLIMRDFNGVLQQSPDVPAENSRVEICPRLSFPNVPGVKSFGGDFSQYYSSLGQGTIKRANTDSLAIIGYPISEVKDEPSGDCSRITSILYTERQRLELQPEADWPYRVVGTQLGTEVYRTRYKPTQITRLNESSIFNPRFKAFYERYGGLTVFGLPISGELEEKDAQTGKTKTVQYFERARLETVNGEPENPNPLYSVQLGLLGREYAGIASQCPGVAGINADSSASGGIFYTANSVLSLAAILPAPRLGVYKINQAGLQIAQALTQPAKVPAGGGFAWQWLLLGVGVVGLGIMVWRYRYFLVEWTPVARLSNRLNRYRWWQSLTLNLARGWYWLATSRLVNWLGSGVGTVFHYLAKASQNLKKLKSRV